MCLEGGGQMSWEHAVGMRSRMNTAGDWRLTIDDCQLTTGQSEPPGFLVPLTLTPVSGCCHGVVRWKQTGLSGRHLRMWGVGVGSHVQGCRVGR